MQAMTPSEAWWIRRMATRKSIYSYEGVFLKIWAMKMLSSEQ
jgi:hypothetical protein